MATSTTANAAIATIVRDSEIQHQITHGGETTQVQTDGGLVDSFAKTIKDLKDAGSAAIGPALGQAADEAIAEMNERVDEVTERVDNVATQIESDYGSLSNAVGAAAASASDAAEGALQTAADRIAAEAARDAINTTGRVFATPDAGVVAGTGVAPGQTYSVLAMDLLSWDVYENNAGSPLFRASSYTSAYIDRVADLSAPRYYYGKLVAHAIGDQIDRGGAVLTEDGYLYAKFAFRAANGIQLARANDGFWEFLLGAVDALTFSGGGSIETTATYYFLGKKVTRAWGDPGDRASIIETEDGKVYIQRLASLRGGNGIYITQAPDGFLDFALGAVDLLSFSGGDTLGGAATFYFDGKRVTWARGDLSNRGSIVETEDGEIYIEKLNSPALARAGASAPLETAAFIFEVETVASKQQIFRTAKSSGSRVQITTLGNNSVPRLSLDGAKLVYSTDRSSGKREGYYQLLSGAKFGGAIEHPVVPLRILCAIGDSLTAGDYASAVASALGIPLAAPSSDPRSGIGSQKGNQAVARYGATAQTCSVSGNQLVAGANLLTAISLQFLSRSTDATGMVRSLPAVLDTITGVLTSTQSATAAAGSLPYTGTDFYTYTFTPDAGQALPRAVAAGASLVVDPQLRQDCILLLWIGRNNVGDAGWSATVKTDIANALAGYKPLVRKVVVFGTTNSKTEPAGSTNYNAIVAHNNDLAALYPDSFFDVRPTLNAGTANDTPSPDLTVDDIHYNNAGRLAIAAAVTDFINSKGWFPA